MRFSVIPGLIAALGLSACTTELQSWKLDDQDLAAPQLPSQYYLKRQDFAFKIVRELTACGYKDPSVPDPNELEIKVSTTAKVFPILRADPDQHFLIPYEKLAAGNKTSSLTVSYYPDRTIKSINAAVEDKTAEIIAQGTKIAATIATGIPVIGFDADVLMALPEFKPRQPTPADICTKSAKVALDQIKTEKQAIKDANTEIEKLTEQIDVRKAALGGNAGNVAAMLEELDKLAGDRRTQIRDKDKAGETIDTLKSDSGLIDTAYVIFRPEWNHANNTFNLSVPVPLDSNTKAKWFTPQFAAGQQFGVIPMDTPERRVYALDLNLMSSSDLDAGQPLTGIYSFDPAMADKLTRIEIRLYLRELARFKAGESLPKAIYTDLQIPPDGVIHGVVVQHPMLAELFVCPNECPGTLPEIERLMIERVEEEAQAKEKAEPKADAAAVASAVGKVVGKAQHKGRYAIPQAGPVMLLKLKNDAFENSKIELAISADGRIEKFGFVDQASAPVALGAAQTSVSTTIDTIKAVRTRDIEEQKLENEALSARKTELELKKAIDEFEKEGFD